MGLFGQMGDMYKLQKEAKKIKKELARTHVFAETDGLKVTVNCEQEVLSVEIRNEELLADKSKLEKAFVDAANRAVKKGQQVAAEKMKDVMGMMGGGGFPGMGGK